MGTQRLIEALAALGLGIWLCAAAPDDKSAAGEVLGRMTAALMNPTVADAYPLPSPGEGWARGGEFLELLPSAAPALVPSWLPACVQASETASQYPLPRLMRP